MKKEITKEDIKTFLEGTNPLQHLTNIECGYNDNMVSLIIRNGDKKYLKKDDFKPFCWVKYSACIRMYKGDRNRLKWALNKSGIKIKALEVKDENGKGVERLEKGFKYLFYADKKMTFAEFMKFFEFAGTPIYPKKGESVNAMEKEFFVVSPIEQYMISTGIRLFKGYDNYDDLKRLVFDLETQGLEPEKHAIDLNGIRTNKGFEQIIATEGTTDEERKKSELEGIRKFLKIVATEQPDVILGYNSENFDWNFIIKRLEILGTSLEEETKNLFPQPIYKKQKETVLKLGGEVEYFNQTILWGTTILDALHAVRRAQAIDSNMKSANLKKVTKYAKLNKRNRVYIPGDKITEMWNMNDENQFAFNDENGKWYKIDDTHPLKNDFVYKSGHYLVERYNLDDIWETDKVDLRFNESNFLLCKLIPTSFQRACTMGTAGIWKLIMSAWSYTNGIAIPDGTPSRRFVGGLSRLLKTGYIGKQAKFDYNSLYPSILITWHIQTPLDIMNAMLSFLEYILTEREKFKGLKKIAGKKADAIYQEIEKKTAEHYFDDGNHKDELMKLQDEKQHWDSEKNANDKKQLPFKIFGNSFFGSYGCGGVIFPWSDIICAEKTTCIGRQSLRLMIYFFSQRNYQPIVGDSVVGDTPLFIKYKDSGLIDIKPICEIIDENNTDTDALGREYDYSEKPYQVLCRSGWSDVKYVYRHKTEKKIYNVSDGIKSSIDVTEDHSLFNEQHEKISPKDITKNTKLEYYDGEVGTFGNDEKIDMQEIARKMWIGEIDRVPVSILNGSKTTMNTFYMCWLWAPFTFNLEDKEKMFGRKISKTAISGINYIDKMRKKIYVKKINN